MPLQRLATWVALERAGWTHAEIADKSRVSRSAVSAALAHTPNPFPDAVNVIAANIIERAVCKAHRAIAAELRVIAAELESRHLCTSSPLPNPSSPPKAISRPGAG